MTRHVAITPTTRRCWAWLPPALPVGALVIGPDGERLRIRGDGGADPVEPGGHPRPGIAADPSPAAKE